MRNRGSAVFQSTSGNTNLSYFTEESFCENSRLIFGKISDNKTALAGKSNNDWTIRMHQLQHIASCATL